VQYAAHDCHEPSTEVKETDLAQVIQVDSVVGGAKGHKVAVSGAELHTAHIGLAIDASHSALISNAP